MRMIIIIMTYLQGTPPYGGSAIIERPKDREETELGVRYIKAEFIIIYS